MHECVHVGVPLYDRVAIVYKNRKKKSTPLGVLFNLKYSLLIARTIENAYPTLNVSVLCLLVRFWFHTYLAPSTLLLLRSIDIYARRFQQARKYGQAPARRTLYILGFCRKFHFLYKKIFLPYLYPSHQAALK